MTLSPRTRAALQSRNVSGSWSYRGLRRLLRELRDWDLKNERRHQNATLRRALAIVAVITAAAVGIVIALATRKLWIAPVISVLPLPLLLHALRRFKEDTREPDLPNEFHQSIRPFLRRIRHDIDPNRRIRVALNLSQSHPLCRMRIPLHRGGSVFLSLDTTIECRVQEYRSRNSRLTRNVWRKTTRVSLQFRGSSHTRIDAVKIRKRKGPDQPGAAFSPKALAVLWNRLTQSPENVIA